MVMPPSPCNHRLLRRPRHYTVELGHTTCHARQPARRTLLMAAASLANRARRNPKIHHPFDSVVMGQRMGWPNPRLKKKGGFENSKNQEEKEEQSRKIANKRLKF